jgi:hypothetical protein
MEIITMTEITDPPIPAIKRSIVQLQCTLCGAETHATCSCGAIYRPKASERVADYDRANPGKSTRQAAGDLGISQSEVQRSRQLREPDGSPEPETITGRDGKNYPAKKPSYIPDPPPPIRDELIEQALELVRQMTPAERIEFIRQVGRL